MAHQNMSPILRVLVPIVAVAAWIVVRFLLPIRWNAADARLITCFAPVVVVLAGVALSGSGWARLSARLRDRRARRASIAAAVVLVLALLVPFALSAGRSVGYAACVVSAIALGAAASKRPWRGFFLALWSIAVGLVASEVFMILLRRNPTALAGSPLVRISQFLYHRDFRVIQFDPNCAVHDPELGYILKPSSNFEFTNTEYSTSYSTNALGLRDSEEDLSRAEVIVLGDSFAMGWGVEGDQTFAARIESVTNRRTLNAGVSSYGTARELMLLRRIPAAKSADVVVIQYHDNDHEENGRYVQDASGMKAMTAEAWQELCRTNAASSSYRFGGHVAHTIYAAMDALGPAIADAPPVYTVPEPAEEVRLFLDVLTGFGDVLAGKRIVVVSFASGARYHTRFAAALKAACVSADRPDWVRSLEVVDDVPGLDASCWFVVDDHINARGHGLVGDVLSRIIASSAK